MYKPDFGDYCLIEQYRYRSPNEMYLHKVIGSHESNSWVDVPVKHSPIEVLHETTEEVTSCICCGVDETIVRKYRTIDLRSPIGFNVPQWIKNLPGS